MDTWYMTEFVLQISEVLFSINDAGTTGSPYEKMKLIRVSHTVSPKKF